MKKIILYVTAFMFFILKGFTQKQFEITGEVESSFNDKYIYLYGIDWSGLNPKIADSSLIKNGRFIFNGHLNTPGLLVSLYAKDPRQAFTQLYIQPGKMQISIKETSWFKDENISLKNAPVSDQYRNLRLKTKEKENELGRLRYHIDSLSRVYPDSSFYSLSRAADSLNKQLIHLRKNYIKDHSRDYMSLVVLSYFLWNRIELGETKTLYAGLSNELKDLEEGKTLLRKIKALDAVQIGKQAPEFSLNDTSARTVKLSDHKGYYVLLDFWASWCKPCLEKVPAIKNFYETNKDKNLKIIGISLDEDKTKWLSAIKKYHLNWQHLSDLKGWKSIVCSLYNVEAIPRNMLIDPEGKIIAIDLDPETYKLNSGNLIN